MKQFRLTALDNNRPLTLYFDSYKKALEWSKGRELTLIKILEVSNED